jgi:hypothetical protein
MDATLWARADLECWIDVEGYRTVEGSAAVALLRREPKQSR